jgi:butyryl-CoA dehydrogenase
VRGRAAGRGAPGPRLHVPDDERRAHRRGPGRAALGYTAYLHALDYARERRQGREGRDPQEAPVPIIRHADVRRMLLAQKATAEGAYALCLYAALLHDRSSHGATEVERREASLLLDLLTPIVKAWPSQHCVEANSLAIQVHGGYGYTRDYASSSSSATTG